MHTFRTFLASLALVGAGAPVAVGQVVPATPGRIVNFSVRAFSGAGENVLISGFVLGGQNTRPLLVRAIGPGLARYGVADFMTDPELHIFRTPAQEMTNDSWDDSPDLVDIFHRLGAFDLAHGMGDAAVLLPLAPGAYTAHARGHLGATGEVLLELYDAADPGEVSQSVANVSLRGQIGAANPLMIAGFVVSPGAPKRVLLRAVGPALAGFGVAGALGNPHIRVYSGSNLIAENADWATNDPAALEEAFASAGAFPLTRGSLDAALVLTLDPGAYTAHVDDPTGGRGVTLIEIYDLDPPAPGGIAANPDPGTGALPSVSLLPWQDRLHEGTTPGGSVLVVRSGDVSQPLRVFLAKSGTATEEDILGLPSSVLVPAGSSTVSVPVSAWDDNVVEPSEVLTISLQTNPAYLISGLGRVHLVIEDATIVPGTGWKAEYFNNTDVSGTPVLTRTDPEINLDWGGGSPAPEIHENQFSARWTGCLEVPAGGVYTLTTRSDDGVRVWVDDQLVIDAWTDQANVEHAATVSLAGGVRYPVRVEYYDEYSAARIALYWQTAGASREVVPVEAVFQAQAGAPAITSPTEALALTGGAFTYQLTAVGGAQNYQVLDLPPGLTLNPTTGAISGVPTTAGEYHVVLEATNAKGTGAEVLTLNIMSAGAPPEAERWSSAVGTSLDAPTTPPNTTQALSAFESTAPAGTVFERVRGFFIAPESGEFEFWIAASGPARLQIADSDQPADRWPRARVASGTAAHDWFATPDQAALPIRLEAGHRYYFEATQRPATSGGHLAVAWQRPSAAPGTVAEPVPAWVLSKYVAATASDDGKALYLASLRPQSGVVSPASGLVSLLHDEAAHTATLTLRMTGLSSTEVAAYLLVGPEGQVGPLIQALPNGQFNNFTWQLHDTGNLTVGDLESALRDGLLYVVVYSGNYPEGELRGQFGPSAGSSVFVPPAPPPAFTLGTPSAADAARFLTQATFGPTDADINQVIKRGYQGWLSDQFGRSKTNHLDYLDALSAQLALQDPPGRISAANRQEAWWDRVVNANDQLRQRVAFALTETLVVSDQGVLSNQPEGVAAYYDIMVDHAFGNFHDLLEAVTLSPAMGNYLSMLRNARADPAHGTLPDENYAREVMQLFTIGLNKLHPDGTLVLDTNGVPIPTYTQDNILGLARVFTGWSYHAAAGEENFKYGARDFRDPMMLYPEYHEMGDKLLLESSVLRGGRTGTQELDLVLDLLFNHPNTGPFICRQLIQRLVTSNPSPGYVYRVAQVFADNGQGVRGDLKAVVQGILLDYEARSPDVTSAIGYGKLREPLLRVSHLWRAFQAKPETGFPYSYRNPERDLMQAALRAPTVFNFFEPSHVHPGILAAAGLVAPEFQITNEQSLVSTTNALRRAVFRGLGSSEYPVTLDLSAVEGLVNDPDALLDWMNRVFLNGQMSSDMRSQLRQTLDLLDIGHADAAEKVRSIINLVTTSPEYAVQK